VASGIGEGYCEGTFMKKLAYKMLKGLGINPPDVMYTVMGFKKKLLSFIF